MTHDLPARRAILQAGVAMAGLAATGAARAQTPASAFEFGVRDIVFGTLGGKSRLARVYQPKGAGPFPAVVQIHGGAWNGKDRTDGQHTSLELCAAGIVVISVDFRNAPEAPYPASLADINYAFRWAKAHARDFGANPDGVGAYGTSSGGHQAILAAMRPDDPRYRVHPLPEAPDMDARVAFVVSGWGVLYPLVRQELARARNAEGDANLVKSHGVFFGNDAAQIEATPALAIERGEKGHYPPALVFQGTKDEWTSVELAERLAKAWRGAGGTMDLFLAEGERHTFLNDHPFSKNSLAATEAMKAFIRKHGSRQQAAR